MTKRDFELIAKVLRETEAPTRIIEAFAYELAQKNPRFDPKRFMKASAA